MFTISLQPDDVLVWEYALNDINHTLHKGYDANDLLRHVEYLLNYCAEKKVRFLPVILLPLPQEKEPEEYPYKTALKHLFEARHVAYIDISEELRRKYNVSRVPDDFYADKYHYLEEGFATDHIAHRCNDMISQATVPAAGPTLHTKEGWSLKYWSDFKGGQEHSFRNRLMTLEAQKPDPFLTCRMQSTGVVTGIVMVTSLRGRAFVVRSGDKRAKVSAVHDDERFDKGMLKIAFLPSMGKGGLPFSPDTITMIRWADTAGRCLADFGFIKNLNPQQLQGHEAMIIGLLGEERS